MNNKKVFSRVGFSYLTYALVIILAGIGISLLISNIPGIKLTANTISCLNLLCNYVIPIPIFLFMMRNLNKTKIEKKSLSLKFFIYAVIIAICLMWIGNSFSIIITSLISSAIAHPITNPVENLISSPQVWVNILIVTLAAPIFEEYFFRKVLIDRTIKYGELLSVLLSALIFGLFHGNLSQFFYAFLIGGFFAIIYIRTGNILYTMALHLIINFTGSIIPMIINTQFNSVIIQLGSSYDLIIFAIFVMLLIASFMIFIFNEEFFDLKKADIPLKTAFLNVGMLLFIAFEVIRIILYTIN